jgi:hypothetical protein
MLSRLLVGAVILVAARAHAAPPPANVPYTKTPIQVSGGLSQFPAGSQLFTIGGTINNTAAFQLAWDDTNLYVGVEVQDAALFCTPEPPDSQNAWANDAVELMFDLKSKKTLAQGDQDFRQWIFPLNGQSSTYDAYGCGALGDTSFTGTVQLNLALNGTLNDATPDTGYTLIVAIPWTDLATTPADGVSFGFDAAIDDVDAVAGNTTYQDWAGLTTFAQPDQWGTLTLTGKGGTPPGSDAGVGPRPDGGSTPPGADGGSWPLPDKGTGVTRPKESVGCSLVPSLCAAPRPVLLLLVVGSFLVILRRRPSRRA